MGTAEWAVMKTLDPRVLRTRASLQEALLQLCRETDVTQVSISDITEAAGVNRSTFYQHYPDKETLLADALDEYAARAEVQLEADVLSAENPDPTRLIRRYLGHVRENATLYRSILGSTGSPIIVARLTDRITTLVLSGLTQRPPRNQDGVPLAIEAAGIAGSFIGMVRAWLEMKPLPTADRVTEWIVKTLPTE